MRWSLAVLVASLLIGCGPFLNEEAINALDSNRTQTTNPNSIAKDVLVVSLLAPSGPIVAGIGVTVQVSAVNDSNNLDATFTGTIELSTSDPNATLPGAITLGASDGGIATFGNVTLTTAGTQTLYASSAGSISTPISLQVQAGSMSRLGVIIRSPISSFAFSTSITVKALDAYDNVDTTFSGQVSFPQTDDVNSPLYQDLPAPYTFQTRDQGTKVFGSGFTVPNNPGTYSVSVISGTVSAAATVVVTSNVF